MISIIVQQIKIIKMLKNGQKIKNKGYKKKIKRKYNNLQSKNNRNHNNKQIKLI